MERDEFNNRIKDIIVDGLKKAIHLKTSNEVLSKSEQISVPTLVYPTYRSKDTRRSEQELRLCIIESLLSTTDALYYSIEEPTKQKYLFSEKKQNGREKIEPKVVEEGGRSASFDLSIFDINNKTNDINNKTNIEFKHGTSNKYDITKDLLKLSLEQVDGNYNYFLHILDRKQSQEMIEDMQKKKEKMQQMIECMINEKYNRILECPDYKNCNKKDHVVCYIVVSGENVYWRFSLNELDKNFNPKPRNFTCK